MRLVVEERVVGMRELMTDWSLEDAWDAHQLLDAKAAAAAIAANKSRERSGRGR